MKKSTAKKLPKQRFPKPITEQYLYNSALAYLSRFAASTEHLKQVMIRKIDRSCLHHKDQDKEECLRLLSNTIKKLEDLSLLDDKNYAKGMMNSLLSRGQSLHAIRQRLKNKGLPQDIIALVVEEHTENSDQNIDLKSALTFLKRKKMGPFGHSNDTKNTPPECNNKKSNKILGALARAGFSYNLSRDALSMSPEEALDILEN